MHPQSGSRDTVTSGIGPGNTPGGPRPFYLGLDMALKTGTACLLDPLGQEVVPRWTFHNNRPGAEELVDKAAELLQRHGATVLLVGMEATGIYGWHLACFLSETQVLRPWAARVYVCGPPRKSPTLTATHPPQPPAGGGPLPAY